MHWEILIIPLIALGVWILGTLFKGEDERLKKDARRLGNLSGRAPGRRPVTDLDRFLEEARLRREAEEKRKASPAPPQRPPVARPPLSERPPRQREPLPRPTRPPIRIEEAPVAVPVDRPVAQPLVAEAILVVPRPQPAAETPTSLPPPRVPPTTHDIRPSPILQQVRSLLSQPQTAGTAFVLQEIFDRPLCKRHHK